MNNIDTFRPRVSPNPAINSTSVDLRKFKGLSAKVSVINQLGRVVESLNISTVTDEPLRLDVSDFNSGTYFISVEPEGRKAVSTKFMVQRL